VVVTSDEIKADFNELKLITISKHLGDVVCDCGISESAKLNAADNDGQQ